ncbi:uncharacterized protein [Watersipora subatra]|uniref:uncharacterized protein n=1 Tax=Watersipora subatra TaxID=2589382 RepID=UPI00355B0A77
MKMKSTYRWLLLLFILMMLFQQMDCQRQRNRQNRGRNRTTTKAPTTGGGGGSGSRGRGSGSRGPHQRLPQFDQLLAEAGNFNYRNENGRNGRNPNDDILTSDGRNVLFELDVLEPVPCELEESAEGRTNVFLTESDAAIGSGSCVKKQGRRGRKGRGRGIDLTGNGGSFRNRGKRAATSDTTLRWPSTTIAYKLSAPTSNRFSSSELAAIDEAIAEYQRYTCIDFIPRSDQENFINIVRDGGCYSSTGWIYWDQPNVLSLANGCASSKNIPIHELMHALGVYHQHSRPDRDRFVTVNTENIRDGGSHNFVKLEQDEAELEGTVYSYRSVMHYGKAAFSKDPGRLNTITTREPEFQDIIGRATTFSFEDLQLINRLYGCDRGCSRTCPTDSYRGKDCECYCRNGDNFDVPAVLCTEVSECNMIGVSCNCGSRSNACSGLSNTACNTNSGACECDAASGFIDGQCIRVEDAECAEVGQNCLCSRKSANACVQLPNTQCNSGTNACECTSGHMLNPEGDCENINIPCNRIGETCFCSQKSNACGRLANSYCDLLTDRCECDEDFYESPRAPGVCTRAPTCDAVNQACQCTVQRDACQLLPGTACDEETQACVCLPSHQLDLNGNCLPSITSYISDGSSVAPFMQSDITTSNNGFTPDLGRDPTRKRKTFGVMPNFWRLRASGTGRGQKGAIQTSTLPAGTWCIQFSYRMKYAALWYQVSNNGIDWDFRGIGANWNMRRFFRKSVKYTSESPLIVRFLAEVYPELNQPWEVLIDPVVIKQC